MSGTAFQILSDDIESVLHNYTHRLINTRGLGILDLSVELLDEIDHNRIEKAALAASNDLDEQTNAAMAEIKANLVDLGVLEF
jgi:hypothetical protein